ncbi:hypothetical protein CDAR_620761 [Caerostris darwini]|uniref:Uncharacterized protein n=1 Tax=Caerostris darwini TaxID=1538125 RepID=A0AAV4URS6_9ARAC|nr:hypothetical protein CDAR_620761 [Caerostris darwini]
MKRNNSWLLNFIDASPLQLLNALSLSFALFFYPSRTLIESLRSSECPLKEFSRPPNKNLFSASPLPFHPQLITLPFSYLFKSRIQQRKSSINRSVQSVFEYSIHGLLLLHNASVSQQHYRRRNVVKGSKSLTELFNITHRALSPPVCHLPLLLSR